MVARRRCSLWLVAGTVPVLITGLGQLLVGWQGPWQLLGGLIVWFVEPGGKPEGRLSGLFDYANIAGAWLAMVWPLIGGSGAARSEAARAFCRARSGRRLGGGSGAHRIPQWMGCACVGRSSGAGAAQLALVGAAAGSWLLPVVLWCSPVPAFLQDPARQVVPDALWARLNDSQYASERVLASTRISQWTVALQLIAEHPWFGWGAAAFSILYPLRTGQWHGHAHNLPLELAISHGLPAASLVVGLVLVLMVVLCAVAFQACSIVPGGQHC